MIEGVKIKPKRKRVPYKIDPNNVEEIVYRINKDTRCPVNKEQIAREVGCEKDLLREVLPNCNNIVTKENGYWNQKFLKETQTDIRHEPGKEGDGVLCGCGHIVLLKGKERSCVECGRNYREVENEWYVKLQVKNTTTIYMI
jgi:hypothetical protein